MTFESKLLEITGTAEDSFDIKAMVRRCFFYDFDGYPVRLWDGQGTLVTTDGVGNPVPVGEETIEANEWLGTIDGNGTNGHVVPAVSDVRDGTSPQYETTLPFLDKATYDALKADQALAKGREVTCYHALFEVGEGLLPQTPIRFAWRMKIFGVTFAEQLTLDDSGKMQATYSASAQVRTLEHGRSRLPGGLMNDTTQREKARLLGLSSDSGCSFVAGNANRTYIAGGG